MFSRRYDDEDPTESTPLAREPSGQGGMDRVRFSIAAPDNDDDSSDEEDLSLEEKAAMFDRHTRAAHRLSVRLLAIEDDPEEESRVLHDALDLSFHPGAAAEVEEEERARRQAEEAVKKFKSNLLALASIALATVAVVGTLTFLGTKFVGPPRQPVGPYQLVERQEGMEFFNYYNFYEGRDSAGSAGFNMYVGEEAALKVGILNVTHEEDVEDVYHPTYAAADPTSDEQQQDMQQRKIPTIDSVPFIYMGSSPTEEGPRDSIRLEGKRRFNRGLFVIDLRHMPAGCGIWPAFWLTDEANWPVNGEIDIVEGVNYQSAAKTALHSTRGCSMEDVPVGVKSGTWDTAIGIPNKKTGVPDMTMRYATDCFVYNPKQWLNQGCVAVDKEGNSLGVPLNQKGGGVYVLEWDPINRHIRSWVFSPHKKVPDNLRDAIRTASQPDAVMPDPALWDLPYGYYAIGEGTDCPSSHFRNMRLVFNMAFCGSVAGNRFQMDCPKQAKKFKTCNDWIQSEPEELNEAYWKIRGVYVYDRAWEKAWL